MNTNLIPNIVEKPDSIGITISHNTIQKRNVKEDYVTIKYLGKIYKIRKSPQENSEQAYDRAWYIATNPEIKDKDLFEKECQSYIYANNKYYNMQY